MSSQVRDANADQSLTLSRLPVASALPRLSTAPVAPWTTSPLSVQLLASQVTSTCGQTGVTPLVSQL